MGATNAEAIVNLALRRIGQKKITSIADATDTTAVKANDVYALLRDQLLAEHPWPFAVKSAILGRVVDAAKTITGATKANPVVITAAAHGFANGDVVSIISVGGMVELNGKTFTVANQTANTFELENTDGTSFTTYTSGGTVGKVTTVTGEFDFDNRYELPSGYLRILKIQGWPTTKIKHAIQSGGTNLELHTNEDSVNIQYIGQVTDTTKFSDTFVRLFALLLASWLAFTISQSRTMAHDLREEYDVELAKAKGLEAQGRGSPREIRQDDVIEARAG